MPPRTLAPMLDSASSTIPTPFPAGIEEIISQMGAQFYTLNGSQKFANVTKPSDSAPTTQDYKRLLSSRKMLDLYLQTASRTEILCLGIQSPHSSRVFDKELIRIIDAILLRIDFKAPKEAE